MFGNEGWLQLFSLKQMRRRQSVLKKEYEYKNPYLNALGTALKTKVENIRDALNQKTSGVLEEAKEVNSSLEETQYNKSKLSR